MEWGKQMEKHQENAKLSLYQNTNYSFERSERKTMILDLDIGTNLTFNIELEEPIIIDKLSDIYLEYFITSNCKQSNKDRMGFILKIDQFNIKTNTNNNSLLGGIFIPNEEGDSASAQVVVHKGRKINYICSINPTKLSKITGTLTSFDGLTAFTGTGHAVVEFVIIARDDDN